MYGPLFFGRKRPPCAKVKTAYLNSIRLAASDRAECPEGGHRDGSRRGLSATHEGVTADAVRPPSRCNPCRRNSGAMDT